MDPSATADKELSLAPNSLYSHNIADGTTVHDTHSCSQHCLVLEQTNWVLSWCLNEENDSSGDQELWVVGSRFWDQTLVYK